MISTEDRLELVEKSLAKQKRATLILGCFLVAAISWGGAVEAKRAERMDLDSWPINNLTVELTNSKSKPFYVRPVGPNNRDIEFK
jgi:hypothetical protein